MENMSSTPSCVIKNERGNEEREKKSAHFLFLKAGTKKEVIRYLLGRQTCMFVDNLPVYVQHR